uniref:ARAD1C01848p n=1 Tax=Blastobotrys adeninivorans TaxID=409370 RepID=A0A060SZM7_BLAAD
MSEPTPNWVEITSAPSDMEHSRKRRKRVTRACDECRRKKVRCDGKMPCNHCSAYSYDCTYDQPSSRRKVVDKTDSVKLRNAEVILEALLPGVDVLSSTTDVSPIIDQIKSGVPLRQVCQNFSKNGAISSSRPSDIVLRMANSGGALSNPDTHVSPSLLSPQSTEDNDYKVDLPPKHVAIQLIESVWENACVLFRFYHRPSFIRDMDLLYETDPEDYSGKQLKILPLAYSVLAVGVLFSMDRCHELGIKDASEGYRYFTAAKKMLDITDCRDVYSIQSVVMMILFLQCSSRLSTCYSYIGIALRAALRLGLHRKVNHSFNPIELETRKRLFWAIRKMDIYVNSMLGLPRGISDNDFDQEMPAEIDDENITEDGYYPQKDGKLSSSAISNSHTRLMTILGHIISEIYPVKRINTPTAFYEKIDKLEAEITEWYDSVPTYMRPGADVPLEYLKANRLLSLTYCYTQIILYRPFIHYCSPNLRGEGNNRARLLGFKCINVARRAIHLADDLVSKKLLNGAYWFSVYTIFFSVACLVYYIHENSFADPGRCAELSKDAELGRNTLAVLKDSSMTASRTHNLLMGMFRQLNRQTSQQGEQPAIYSVCHASNLDITKIEDELEKSSYRPMATADMLGSLNDTNGSNSQQGGLNNNNNNSYPDNNTNGNNTNTNGAMPPSSGQVYDGAEETPYSYMPGLMDQVDQQLFGRFLPPYMMQNVNDASYSGGIYPDPMVQSQPQQPQPQPQPQPQQPQQMAPPQGQGSLFSPQSWDDFFNQNADLSGLNYGDMGQF